MRLDCRGSGCTPRRKERGAICGGRRRESARAIPFSSGLSSGERAPTREMRRLMQPQAFPRGKILPALEGIIAPVFTVPALAMTQTGWCAAALSAVT